MKLNFRLPTFTVIVFTVLSVAIVSCKKDKKATPAPTPTPTTATRADLTKDSIFLYAKQIYYWNDALPTYEVFNPRKYTSATTDLGNYEKELFDITQLKINTATGLPYEYYSSNNVVYSKYSYISDITNKNPVAVISTEKASVDLEGNGNDLGLKLGAYGTNGDYKLYLQAVYQNSPADKAGLIRSDRITKINGTSIGNNFPAEADLINSLFTATTATLTIAKSAGGEQTVTLNKVVYKSSPIYKTKIFTTDNSKKIGYLAYARFSNITNSQADFDAAFSQFAAAGVTDLIIDLRYNGGGYVNTAEYLINLIASPDMNDQVMFTESYNSLMQSNQATILANQPLLDGNGKVQYRNGRMITYADIDYSVDANTQKFSKKGSLNGVNNIVFIVSGSTASASELVINSLKPYKTVKLVGTTTYGKPVGFFPVRLENRYDVFMSLFSTKNKLNEGNYYAGFTPDVPVAGDDATHDFGDRNETRIAAALNLILNGSGTVTNSAGATMVIGGTKVSVNNVRQDLPVNDGNEFNGMIKTNFKLK